MNEKVNTTDAPKRKPLKKRPIARSVTGGGGVPSSLKMKELDMNFIQHSILKWDFMSAFCANKTGEQISYSDGNMEELEASLSKGSFENVKEYQSVWLHLVLRETFSVILKKFEEENICGTGLFVDMEKADGSPTTEAIQRLKVVTAGNGGGRPGNQFISLDTMVLLVPPILSDIVCDELKCKRVSPPPPPLPPSHSSASSKQAGGKSIHRIVADRASAKRSLTHTNTTNIASGSGTKFSPQIHGSQCMLALVSSRSSPMEVKVLNTHWNLRGKRRMVMIPISSLVSSMREMNALANIGNTNPELLRAMIHPQSCKFRNDTWEEAWKAEFQSNMSDFQVGDGFADCLATFFNNSQQRAILAASRASTASSLFLSECGESRITLIKGPPGTGTCFS